MLRNVVRVVLVFVPCLTLLAWLAFDCPIVKSQAASIENHHFVNASQLTCGQWNRIPNSAKNAALQGVASISLNDVWAVGFTDNTGSPNNRQPFTMHWDGMRWHSMSNPTLAGTFNVLYAVSALSTSDVWAVGEGSLNGNGYNQALIEQWDGVSWSIVPSPNVGVASALYSVANIPGTDQVWAVGSYASNNADYALIDFWDGTQWNVLPSPPVNSYNSALQSVTAFSTTDAWAVGWDTIAGNAQTLVEHWDGTQWNVVPSPNNSPSNTLFSVTPVPNTNELWAVGDNGGGKNDRTLVEHWDGSVWSVVPSPSLRGSNLLLGTVATATNDAWSVGYYAGGKALIEHWDGIQWSIVSQPASKISDSSLWSLSTVPNQTEVWAVGFFYTISNQMYHPLTLLYC